MIVPKFTEEFRKEELDRGRRSLFHFGVAILGFDAWNARLKKSTVAPLHRDLCSFLEGRPPHFAWNRALVTAFRGSAKSTWCTQSYPLWRCLYIPDFSVKLIENSSQNAKINHFIPLMDLLISSKRSDYIQWLYSHRLPSSLEGSNSEQLKLIQNDPLAPPAITYWGIESKFEGWHGNLVILDDPEGADAEKSVVPNEASWQAYQRAIPLLKDPTDSQILVVATPHGQAPLVYRLIDRELDGELDNSRRAVKVFFKPILNEDGKSQWPARFPESYIDVLRKEDIWDQQFMLRRGRTQDSTFDMSAVMSNCYEWVDSTRSTIRYKAFEFDPDKVGEDGFVKPEQVETSVDVRQLRFYIHIDPKHKLSSAYAGRGGFRPSKAAISVCGVAPDNHVFVLETWCKDADVTELVRETYRLYKIFCPHTVTFESIGAQLWFTDLVKAFERSSGFSYSLKSSGFLFSEIEIPRLSSRLFEAQNKNESKEFLYRERLSGYFNHGILHIHARQEEMIHQLSNVMRPDSYVDLIDCLVQGPPVWKPGVTQDDVDQFRKRQQYAKAFAQPRTGYFSPQRAFKR